MKTQLENLLALVVVATPLLMGTSALGAGPDRSSPPALGPAPSLQLPPIERFALSNGIEVHLLTKRQVPLVEVDLLVRAGSATDPKGQYGLAEVTAAMLDEGAGDKSALELADAVDYLGAKISTWSSYHFSGVDLFTPLERLDEALALMADVALRPTFAAAELDRLRLDRLTELQQARDEPRALASIQTRRLLYGVDHPYGGFSGESDLKAMSAEDLRRFHNRYFRAGNAALIVVGATTVEEIRPLLERHFGGWEGAATPIVVVEDSSQVQGRKIYLVDKPGAAQSEIRFARIGVDRKSDDYFSLEVMNTLLGNSFTSRLNSNLREDKGWAYGARSRFHHRVAKGPFVAQSAVQTDVTDKALLEFVKEFQDIRTISDEEYERVRNLEALQYPRRFQTIEGIAGQLSEMVRFDLDEDYFNEYVGRTLAVTKSQAEEAARRYVVPEHMVVVVVGDRAKVEEGIRALDLGPIEVLSVDDVVGPAPTL